MEEQVTGEEDLRGIEAFIAWCVGEPNREIRRVAEVLPESDNALAKPADIITDPKAAVAEATAAALEIPQEDFLTQLKKRHAKTKDGEEARYQGTILGKDMGEREIKIEGYEEWDSIQAWSEKLRREKNQPKVVEEEEEAMEVQSGSTSPLSELTGDMG